jgi:hypothetical protein
MAMSIGALKRAAVPVPSADPAWPAVPANVVTTPPGAILRIVLLNSSATYMFPEPSTVALAGPLKRPAVPVLTKLKLCGVLGP